ncbi:MAG: pilus assembly protein [Proteobacteria bacterium]|nr:pilus assembly protein [Pseudomonadota bacterium]MBU1612284.1 pilus assembly protein [Pseudomonadota bacterium]
MRTIHRQELGLVTLEFAFLVVLILLPLLCGVIDGNHVISASNGVEHAAREGALAASRGNDPQTAALMTMGGYDLDQNQATVTLVAGAGYPDPGSEVVVRVSYNLSGSTVLPLDVIWPSGISAEAVMRHE